MSRPRVFAARLRALFVRGRLDRQLEDELRFHLEMQTEDNLRIGMSPEEARRAALRRFGGMESMKEEYREYRTFALVENLFRDVRHALRTFARNPGFTAVIVASLALGIGANTAIYSLASQILLRPPGILNPDRIVVLREKFDKLNLNNLPVSPPTFADARDSRAVFEHTAAMREVDLSYAGGGTPQRLQAGAVSSEWFDVFGAKPALGRVFLSAEDYPGANRVVVLSHSAWLRFFGADPAIAGRAIELDRQPYHIIGVMSAGFDWPHLTDVWIPLALPPRSFSQTNRFNENLLVMSLRRPGVSFSRGNQWLKILTSRVSGAGATGATAKTGGWGMFSIPFTEFNAGDTRTPVLVLLGAVGLVLLIACANSAGLMLARASAHAQETALRGALGASRRRLIGQTLTESLVLSCAGALAGLALAYGVTTLILRLAPADAVAGIAPRVDVDMLEFTAAAAVFSALVFGIAPAWQLSGIDPGDALKSGGRAGAASPSRQQFRSTLVVAEAALALVLLVAAGLFLQSFARLQDVNPGFDAHGVMTAIFSLPKEQYPDGARQATFYRKVLDRLANTAGVSSAAIGFVGPFCQCGNSGGFVRADRKLAPGEPPPHSDMRMVTPGYFKTLAIPLKQGRTFTEWDLPKTEPVVVIDETLARQYWPSEDPVGKQIQLASHEPTTFTVTGVVGHVLASDLAADNGKGVVYFSLFQQKDPISIAWIVARTPGNPASLSEPIREAVRAADPEQPVHTFKSLDELVSDSLASRRFVMRLLGFFAATALFMAALGLYGVIGYSVTLRTREIGIRTALGEQSRSVLAGVLWCGLRLAGIGVAAGAVGSILVGHILRSQLFQVNAFDPAIFTVMAAALLLTALLAGYLPARRAVRVDPLNALRSE